MRIFKKNYGRVPLKGSQALELALCYGWITGPARAYDDVSVLWRFAPRRPRSIWSKVNTEIAERLIREGRMKPAGLEEVIRAKKDGRWARAYSPQRTAKVPRDFMIELNKNEKAKTYFKTLNRSSVYAIIFRLQTTGDKQRRRVKVASIVEMLAHENKFH